MQYNNTLKSLLFLFFVPFVGGHGYCKVAFCAETPPDYVTKTTGEQCKKLDNYYSQILNKNYEDSYKSYNNIQNYEFYIDSLLTCKAENKPAAQVNAQRSAVGAQQYEICNLNEEIDSHISNSLSRISLSVISISKASSGMTDSIIHICETEKKKLVVKSFLPLTDPTSMNSGLREFVNSCVAMRLVENTNIALAPLKGAILHPIGQGKSIKDGISIIFENARGKSITNIITGNDQGEKNAAIKAVANYLSFFHCEGHKKYMNKCTEEKIICLRSFCFYLSMNYASFEKKLTKVKEKNKKSIFVEMTSYEKLCKKYNINKSINNINKKDEFLIFFTFTHGDAHTGNLFYDYDKEKKVTAIDYETMANTYKLCSTPAEDIGRFIGSLWVVASEKIQDSSNCNNIVKGFLNLENVFLNQYFKNLEDLLPYKNYNITEIRKDIEDDMLFYQEKLFLMIMASESKKDNPKKENLCQIWEEKEKVRKKKS